MNVTLAIAQERFVDAQIKSGHFVDASEVVREALRQLEIRASMSTDQLGGIGDLDTMSAAVRVMVDAAKSAREDLKAIMAQVKAINTAKQTIRGLQVEVRRDCAANATRRDGEPLDFSRGLGSEGAYHRAPLPYLDPDAAGGVRMAATDLYPGRIERRQELEAVADRLTAELDTLSELGEEQQLRMQMVMERMNKADEAASNALKKINKTADAITKNIK